MVKNKTMDLPDECWELIFKRLGHHYHLDTISLVCKRFLSISSYLLNSITISDSTILLHCNFSKLSQRFRQIKRIHFLCPFDGSKVLDSLMFEVTRSGLNIEELLLSSLSPTQEMCTRMKDLKILTCKTSNSYILIGNSLPNLQELEFCSRSRRAIINKRIEEFAKSKLLRKLCKLNLTVSEGTAEVISHALRYCSNLTSLSVTYSEINFLTCSAAFAIEKSLTYYTRALCSLDFAFSVISDSLVGSIVKANLPLKKLKFHLCKNMTVSGLLILLKKYQSLSEFEFKYPTCLTDQDMDQLSKYLRHVNHIDLAGCIELTDSTFFLLARNCPFLVDIIMFGTSIGKDGGDHHHLRVVDLKKHIKLQFLDLSCSRDLKDESLKRIGYICPNLQMLELCDHKHVTEEGISDIMKSCPHIRHFVLGDSTLETIFRTNSAAEEEESILNIEVLNLGNMISDKGMAMIAKRCPRLLKLKITICHRVTTEGVKEVVEKCPKLMELDVSRCGKVDFDVLTPILLTRPSSMRKVFTPIGSTYILTEEKRNLFMRHGCRLY